MKTEKTNQPKYDTVKEYLRAQIAQEKIPFGSRLPSETELMKRFAVSRTTVRQALADLTSEGLVERRQGSGTYRSDPSTRQPKRERTMLVGVWFNRPAGPLYGPMVAGIRDELACWNYHAVFEGGSKTGDERTGINSLVRKGLDGFIVSPSSDPGDPHDPIIEMVRRGLPLVLVDKRLGKYQTDHVCTNNQMGVEALVRHLLDLGHRRIGFIGNGGVSSVEERAQAFHLTMRRAGLTVEPEWIEVNQDVFHDYGRAAGGRMLSLPPHRRPTAIFGASDPVAESVAQVACEQGLHVPRDLSVVGFDDASFDSDETPWLTTYAQPTYCIGQQAARLLMARLQDPSRQTETILLEGKLIVRSSTAAPPSESGTAEA
ncbi:MAG TPA: GntR family transcriptional regulator [Phycisphaerae bacterium]|nr:GntR family transcriptional regulator [Phycisphaerae bacterium]